MRLTLYVIAISFLLGMSVSAHAQPHMPDEVIVKLKAGLTDQEVDEFVGRAYGRKNMQLKRNWKDMKLQHYKLPKGKNMKQALEDLQNDPAVEYAEPNYLFSKASLPSDSVAEPYSNSRRPSQVGPPAKSGEKVSALSEIESQGGETTNEFDLASFHSKVQASSLGTVIVAVIDTGVDTTHTVFEESNAIWSNSGEIANNNIDDDGNGYVDDVNGWNFVSDTGDMYDDDGHGTHVTGIILNVAFDIFSSDPLPDSSIKIMPLKFLDGNGVGSTSDAIEAIYYAVDNGATVLNNSWGGPSYSFALEEAVKYSYDKGVSFVAAAGNSGTNNDSSPMYPASFPVPNLIAVAATDDVSSRLASFSNFGTDSVHLGGPGLSIKSTYPGDSVYYMSGTSMAAPYAAGTAALMKAASPSMLGYQIRSLSFDGTDYKSWLANKIYTEGRLNPDTAVGLAGSASVMSDQPAYALSFGDRGLASNLSSGGGCGTVTKLMKDGGRSAPGPETWYVLVVLGLLALPMIIYSVLRSRRPQDKRRYDRFAIDSEVKLKLGEKELVGTVSSISLGGVQVNTSALLDQGGIVAMQISSPDGKEQITVEGKIVWSESQKAYGVAFENASSGALSSISQWTQVLKRTG